MLFPTGHTVSRRWRLGPWVAVAGGAALALGTALGRMQLWYPALPSPTQVYGVQPVVSTALQVGGMSLLVAASLMATVGLIARYRAADATLQAQLRWIVVGGVVKVICVTPFYVARYGIHVPDATGEQLLMLCTIGGSVFPLAMGIGMVRHDLWELDRVISRTLVYVPLTAILAGGTAATITLFQRIFVVLTGDTSDVAIIFTTLLLASAFSPVKSALDGFVARALPMPEQLPDTSVGTDAAVGDPTSGAAMTSQHAARPVADAPAGGPADEASMRQVVEELQARLALMEARLGIPSTTANVAP